jgi:hypothetical protein
MAMELPVGLKCPAFTPPDWPNTISADTFKPLTSQNICNFYMARRCLCQEINQAAEFTARTASWGIAWATAGAAKQGFSFKSLTNPKK